MKPTSPLALALFAASVPSIAAPVFAAPAAPQREAVREALQQMPVREVTVFKDGHALVVHQGRVPTDTRGAVLLDYVPTPVLGTFWPYTAEKNARLAAVVASRRRVPVERTALNLRELLEANVGASVRITEQPPGDKYDAVILAVPQQPTPAEMPVAAPAEIPPHPQPNLILLKTAQGVRAIDPGRIMDVTFPEDARRMRGDEEWRNLLTLRMDWPGGKPAANADVGLMYLQKGIRWIPSYKVTIDGKGGARVQLQATVINELADLENVTVNLVIGAPNFESKDQLDPIGFQDTLARLSPYFQADSRTGLAFGNNAFMTQAAAPAGPYQPGRPAEGGSAAGPEVAGAGKNEDLFVFTLKGLTLKKDERMVAPVAEYKMEYKDVYTLHLPFAPPREITMNYDSNQQAEMARLLASPRVLHKIRLCNTSAQPLTTAPALILRDDRVLGQGTMTYGAPGADVDLTLNPAVDVVVKKSEKETQRTPNAITMQGYQYARIDMAGTVTLTNYKKEPVALEITRYVPGMVTSASNNGVVEQVNLFEDPDAWDNAFTGRYSWPSWWNHSNGVAKVTWKLALPAGKSVDLTYAWYYYWR